LPLRRSLGLAIAAGVFRDRFANGTGGVVPALGLVARWTPAPGIEVIPFWGRADAFDDPTGPLYRTRDGAPPRRIARRNFQGPDWARYNGPNTNTGLITRADLGADWRLEAGLFRSGVLARTSYSNLILDIDSAGEGLRVVVADPSRGAASWSGEARLSKLLPDGPRRHRIILAARGRDVNARFGGSDARTFGRFDIEAPFQPLRPEFRFGAQTRDSVRQGTVGLGYELRWGRALELSAGVQKTDYQKRVEVPGVAESLRRDTPWLFNAMAGVRVSERVALYAGGTRGLEENGTAPGDAANRNEVLPALLTEQVEAGVRLKLPANLTLVAGGFRIEKPYFSYDAANVFREQGVVRHQGVELSLSGSPAPGLTLLAGGLLLDASLSGPEVEAGTIGPRPVGRARETLTTVVDWRPNPDGPLSVDVRLDASGKRIATRDNRVSVPSTAFVAVGARYRFRMGEAPASLRVRVNNVANVFAWNVEGDGLYTVNGPRSVSAILTADF
ncbi:MAG: TonB-dependent receptor, partial [Thermaurantiacus sp.]